jgi:hypothetical protein
MRHTKSLSDAERTALNVFHDPELAHTREHDENPSPTMQIANRTPFENPRHAVPAGNRGATA